MSGLFSVTSSPFKTFGLMLGSFYLGTSNCLPTAVDCCSTYFSTPPEISEPESPLVGYTPLHSVRVDDMYCKKLENGDLFMSGSRFGTNYGLLVDFPSDPESPGYFNLYQRDSDSIRIAQND